MTSAPNTAIFRSALLLCSCMVAPTRCIHSVVGLPLGKGTSAGIGLFRNSQSGAHPSAACHSSSRSRGKPRPRTIAMCSWCFQTPLEANEPPKKPGSWDLLIYWRAQNSSALTMYLSSAANNLFRFNPQMLTYQNQLLHQPQSFGSLSKVPIVDSKLAYHAAISLRVLRITLASGYAAINSRANVAPGRSEMPAQWPMMASKSSLVTFSPSTRLLSLGGLRHFLTTSLYHSSKQ